MTKQPDDVTPPPESPHNQPAFDPASTAREIAARFQQAAIDEITASGNQPTDEIVINPDAWKEIAERWLKQQAD